MNEFLRIIFGDNTIIQLLGYLWFFIIGYFIYFLTEVSGRDKESKSTPVKWSWKFWFLDNWRRYITTLLCTYILFRFYIDICGHPFGNFDALTLGLLGDGLGAMMKNRIDAIGFNRENYIKNNEQNNNIPDNNIPDNNNNNIPAQK